MSTRIQLRRGTDSQWGAADPVLAPGEPGWDLTAQAMRVGDGVNTWTNLPPIGASEESWVFDVTDYGAVGDGSTDDTAAINTAMAAASAYAQGSPSRYAQLYVPEGVFKVSSATTKGGATKGNAQLPIPINVGTAKKVTLDMVGIGSAAAMPYWDQTSGQRWGSTILTTLTGQTVDSSWGAPSVIGGPATTGSLAEFGDDFNNVLFCLRNIGVSNPLNPTIGGVDLRGMAQCQIYDCAVMSDASVANIRDTEPDHDWSFGFFTPNILNNDLCVVENVSVYGQYTAIGLGEHVWLNRSASIYCHDGLFISGTLDDIHGYAAGSLSIEGCHFGISTNANTYLAPVHIANVSMEVIASYQINDPTNNLSGFIGLTKSSGPEDISVSGAANVHIQAMNQARGPVTAPTVPATNVTFQNPFWSDADVLIAGGTVTQVAVNGTNTGLTSGWFPVPSGATIKITHSSPPTWTWWLR